MFFMTIKNKNKHSKSRSAGSTRGAKRLFSIVWRSVLAAVACSALIILCFRWINPPASAFMIKRRIERYMLGERGVAINHQWLALESISPYMALAVVASEDQKFPYHWGFDLKSIRDAAEGNSNGRRIRGASTITQQVAKNLFLWSGHSYVRKGFEAYLTLLIEALWPKKRILEVYLNIAEFGEDTYGVHAAAKTLLRKNPSRLRKTDAALLAAVLPSPRRFNARSPSRYVKMRVHWITRQMELLGGRRYLDGI